MKWRHHSCGTRPYRFGGTDSAGSNTCCRVNQGLSALDMTSQTVTPLRPQRRRDICRLVQRELLEELVNLSAEQRLH
jgi:hypothetical protein